jgi:hypothetical protein
MDSTFSVILNNSALKMKSTRAKSCAASSGCLSRPGTTSRRTLRCVT